MSPRCAVDTRPRPEDPSHAKHSPTEEPASQKGGSEIARGMLHIDRADHASVVLDRAEAAGVRDAFKHLLIDPVDLDSPEAEAARRFEREREATRQRAATQRAKRERQRVEKQAEVKALPSAELPADALRTVAKPDCGADLPRRRWIAVISRIGSGREWDTPAHGIVGDPRTGIAWREAKGHARDGVLKAAAAFVELAAPPELVITVLPFSHFRETRKSVSHRGAGRNRTDE
jgi:hypothetical protein